MGGWPGRLTAAAVALAVALPAAACSSGSSPARTLPTWEDVRSHPEAVSVATASPGARWNLEVDVVSTVRTPRTIHVDLDGAGAIDATYPGSPGGSTDPVWVYRFLRDPGPVTVHATSDGGGESSRAARLRAGHRLWVVVTDYQPRRLGVEINFYDRRPGFG